MQELWDNFGNKVYNILPLDPFLDYINGIKDLPYLGWVNWFFPVHEALVIMGAWVGVVGAFFAVQVILRWLKVIQG